MPYNNTTALGFHHLRDLIKFERSANRSEPGAVIGIGALGFAISPKVLRKCGVSTISSSDLTDFAGERGGGDGANSRQLMNAHRRMIQLFFSHYGYTSYTDLDIFDGAEIVHNLTKPIPPNLERRFDLVFDPTSMYVTDPNSSYKNTSRLLKVGGLKIALAMLGDQTNRFDLNPSPNYLIDFHIQRGFRVEKVFLMNRAGTVVPYVRRHTKVTHVSGLLPFRHLLSYLVKYCIFSLVYWRACRQAPVVKNFRALAVAVPTTQSETHVGTEGPDSGQTRSRALSRRLVLPRIMAKTTGLYYVGQALRRVGRRILRLTPLIYPDWTVWVVARKVEESSSEHSHTTSIYRHLDQTKQAP